MKLLTALSLLNSLINGHYAIITDRNVDNVGYVCVRDDSIIVTDLSDKFVDAFPATFKGALTVINEIISEGGEIDVLSKEW